jgi:hypothetical protein
MGISNLELFSDFGFSRSACITQGGLQSPPALL